MTVYSRHYNTRVTPQSEPIPGSAQVPNSAGGYAFAVDDWTRLDRFLILGSEGGSYYAAERKLTRENAEAVIRCIKQDGARVVRKTVMVSEEGRAPKNDPAIFALALCMKLGDEYTRRFASVAVPNVCRIGTHLFQLAENLKALGGWGRNTKRAIANWYLNLKPDRLALNLAKYQSRNGWSHRDLLRKAHIKPPTAELKALFRWAVGKPPHEGMGSLPLLIGAFENLKSEPTVTNAVAMIREHGLPRECIPTELLNSKDVWEALLMSGQGMPLTAMLRNLAKMTSVGLLAPLSEASRFVVRRLADAEVLHAARVHPMAILIANRTYASGHGVKGSLSWTPVSTVVDALEDAFVPAFKNVVPTGKRFLLALDVSGSMSSGNVAGSPLTPREASAAMAMVTARTEQDYEIVGFTAGSAGWQTGRDSLTRVNFTARSTIKSVCAETAAMPMGGTDCALPMVAALAKEHKVDVFCIYTDSETWAGTIHPTQALREYRQRMGIPAKLIVVGLVSNGFTIADPNDAGMMDVVGFDSSAPAVMADFARG